MISEEFTIEQTAVKIINKKTVTQSIHIYNDHGNKVYLGGSNVTTTNGFHLATATDVRLEIPANNELYAISGSGTGDLHIIRPD